MREGEKKIDSSAAGAAPIAPAHTPGPWRTQGWVPTWAYIPVHDARHDLVCSLYPTRRNSRDEVEASARLIAAAPDLLAACHEVLGLTQLLLARDDLPMHVRESLAHSHRIGAVRAAIKRATEA